MREFIRSVYLFFLPLLCCASAMAADVTGQVRDPTGASLPRARITISGTGKRLTTTTDEGGFFAFNSLAPGRYAVQVKQDRFETVTVDVDAVEGRLASVNVTLKLTDVKQQVTVSAQPDSLTLPGAVVAQQELQTIAGNASEIKADQFRGGAITSMDDALSLTPGVFAQPKEGSEEVRLSIRGSGLNVPFGSRGVQILRNGISLSRADGFSNPEPGDASNADYIEVYRGADALEFGAASLGGRHQCGFPNRSFATRPRCPC
jgi:hypothetical protein